jgi:cytochrome bd-type quinol oxidase subunit 1
VLRTRDAVTTASGLDLTFTGFVLLYIGLAAATIWLLRRLATGTPAGLSAPEQLAGGSRWLSR